MGTNYYAAAKPPCPCCNRPFRELHIGKASGGWKFLFAPYPDEDLMSWKAWQQRLSEEGATIRDEYGRPITLEDLTALVDQKQASGVSARTASREQWGPTSRDYEWEDEEGYRFARDADFS